jgi:cyclohexyl-isocyanide hydratase
MNRREFQRNLATVAASLAWPGTQSISAAQSKAPAETEAAPKYNIAMVVYPRMTALDLIGPQYAFASIMGAKVSLVAKTLEPVVSDTGISINPDLTFQRCPDKLDVLFVPGGSYGTLAAMTDTATVDFVRDRGSRATLVTSVCTGSLILGAAGLLRGKRATSHWLVREKVLPLLGATPLNARVVQDGNRITGAGVSAGLDLGLTVVNLLMGAEYAQAVQLMEEYAPQPPFHAGTPESAGTKITTMMMDMHKEFLSKATEAAMQAKSRLSK